MEYEGTVNRNMKSIEISMVMSREKSHGWLTWSHAWAPVSDSWLFVNNASAAAASIVLALHSNQKAVCSITVYVL